MSFDNVISCSSDEVLDSWELSHPVQCENCPWRKDADLSKIPHYSRDLHISLSNTIWDKEQDHNDVISTITAGKLSMMACHDSSLSQERVCIGWLHNQLNGGGNLLLRLRVINCSNICDYRVIGEQYSCFEKTIPYFEG